MMSLFSSFDLKFSIPVWLLTVLFLSLFFQSFYSSSFNSIFFNRVMKFFTLFFLSLKPKSFLSGSLPFLASLFLCVCLVNLFSVFPFFFPLNSQPSSVMTLSLSVWLSFCMFSMKHNFKGFVLHNVPEGSPVPLSFALFLIELVSNMIRPITLTVRLVANILAGHLLMILLSKLVLSANFIEGAYLGLNVVEIFVAVMQSYIFVTMSTLYFSDMN